jgi:hypothetical protein
VGKAASELTALTYGAITISVAAKLLFHEKRILAHRETEEIAIAELKIWRVPRSERYPGGRKYSLFLVAPGRTILGFDNHSPKGPHLHLGDAEIPYSYTTDEKLLLDFWKLAEKAGFEV